MISDANLELLGTQYSYNDYDKFYEQHFVPLRISTVKLLTEPATIEYKSAEDEGSYGDDGLYQGGVIEDGLFIDDNQPATGTGGNNDLIIMPDSQEGKPKDNQPADAAGSITVPLETEKPETGTDNSTLIVPDVKENAPAGGGQTDNGLIIMDEENKAQQPAGQDNGGTFIPLDDAGSTGTKQGNTSVGNNQITVPDIDSRPATNKQNTTAPAGVKTQTEAPATHDDLIIEFNDDYSNNRNNNNGNNSNAGKQDDRQDSYGLEDEYYDLDGF